MEDIKCALIDDDASSIDIIAASLLTAFNSKGYRAIISKYTSPKTFLADYKDKDYSLIFCDIEMPEMNGIEVISKIYPSLRPEVIFVSNREDEVFNSLKVHPFGFIRKKNFLLDINQVIGEYLKTLDQTDEKKLLIKTDQGSVTVLIKDIVYIESRKKKQLVFIKGEKDPYVTLSTMQKFCEKLSKDGFILTHKAFLVNYLYIFKISEGSVQLTTGQEAYLSRRKASQVKQEYLALVKSSHKFIY